MGGTSKQESTTNSTQKTDPWSPAVPQLQGLLNNLGPLTENPGQTAAEGNAFAGLMGNANAGNPYAPAIGNLATNLLNGGGPDRSGYATNAYSGLQNSLNPIANQSTDPYSNTAYKNYLDTTSNDITDRIKSAYAGSGYTAPATGDFAQQLGRGITQGTSPIFAQAQDTLTNQRMGAANALNSGGANLTGLLSGLDQTKLANQQAGVGVSSSALQANDSGYQRILDIINQQRSLPLQNLGNAEGLLLPIAQLGGTSNGTSNTQGSSTMSGAQQFATIAGGLGSLFGGGSNVAKAWASDRRIKDDIEQVGELFDGTPVYTFRYKGEERTNIGLMAQDVEKFAPEAVEEVQGIKLVDYHKATERARRAA